MHVHIHFGVVPACSAQAQNDVQSLRETLMPGCCLERTDSAWTRGKFSGNSKKVYNKVRAGMMMILLLGFLLLAWHQTTPPFMVSLRKEYKTKRDQRGLPANLDLGHGQRGAGLVIVRTVQ